MATIINASNLKFYAEAGHVTPVTGGTSAGDTLYPKLDDTFAVSINGGSPINLNLPYTGRDILVANKTFNCGASVKPFIGNLVGAELLNQILSVANVVSWSGQGQVSFDAENKNFIIPKYAGTLTFTFYSNSRIVSIGNFLNGATIASYEVNGSPGSIPSNGQRTYDDTEEAGILGKYAITVALTFPENTGTQDYDRGWLDFFNNTTDFDHQNRILYDGSIYIMQESEAISLNKTSINLDVTTGVGETVTVAADDNWTIS